jgi:O-antigen ligase
MARIALKAPQWSGQRVQLAAALLIWLCVCAGLLSKELANFGVRSFAIAVFAIVAPVLILHIARFPVYLFCLYAVLVPFNDLLNTSSGPTVTRLLAIVTSGCLVLSMYLKGQFSKPSRTLLILMMLTAYLGATVFWAIDSSAALAAYVVYLSYIGFFVIVAVYPFEQRDLRLILGATMLGALIQSGMGDYLFWKGLQVSGSRLFIGSAEAHSIDPNAFAAGLLAPIAIMLTLFLRSPRGFSKLFCFACLALLFTAFLASGSRGATFGFGVMLVFLMRRLHYKVSLIGVIAVSAIVILTSPIGQRFMQPDVANGDSRFDVWRVGLASLHQYWLGGAGIGNFNNAFIQYYFSSPHPWLSWDRVAHSILLQSAVEYGIIGFALFLAFWYAQFLELAEVRPGSRIADISTALRSSVLGLFVAGFSLDLMSYKYTWLLFSLIAVMRTTLHGMGIATDKQKRERAQPRTPLDTDSAAAAT